VGNIGWGQGAGANSTISWKWIIKRKLIKKRKYTKNSISCTCS
jgi:hypothetical protein